jgi:hypothetical protein
MHLPPPPPWTNIRPQTLKERFAELLPEKIEQIKTLRKFVAAIDALSRARDHLTPYAESMAPRSSTRSPSTKYTAVPEA